MMKRYQSTATWGVLSRSFQLSIPFLMRGRVCDKLIRTVRFRGAMWRVAESTDMVRVRHILSDKLLRDDHRDIEKKT